MLFAGSSGNTARLAVAERRVLSGLLLAGATLLAAPAWAQHTPTPYGHFNQNAAKFKDLCAHNGDSHACGPIAFMNSLAFLQTTYPQFGDTLIDSDPLTTATKLAGLMQCDACTGTATDKYFAGVQSYLNEVAPGKTNSTEFDDPTVAQLTHEIGDQEDVELFIAYYNADGTPADDGHYVTLYDIGATSLSFVDPGGVVNGDEGGALDITVNYTFDDGLKRLVLNGYSGTPSGLTARVDFAFAESPTPEPAAWALMIGGFGMAGLALRRRRAGMAYQTATAISSAKVRMR